MLGLTKIGLIKNYFLLISKIIVLFSNIYSSKRIKSFYEQMICKTGTKKEKNAYLRFVVTIIFIGMLGLLYDDRTRDNIYTIQRT